MVTVTDIESTEKLLRAKRDALAAQLDAVDQALATLAAAASIVADTQERPTTEPAAEAASPVVPTRVKSRRVLSDEHRYVLTEGRRKARHSKEAAAGRAREAPDPAPGLAPASTGPTLPRLVKRRPSGSRGS